MLQTNFWKKLYSIYNLCILTYAAGLELRRYSELCRSVFENKSCSIIPSPLYGNQKGYFLVEFYN